MIVKALTCFSLSVNKQLIGYFLGQSKHVIDWLKNIFVILLFSYDKVNELTT